MSNFLSRLSKAIEEAEIHPYHTQGGQQVAGRLPQPGGCEKCGGPFHPGVCRGMVKNWVSCGQCREPNGCGRACMGGTCGDIHYMNGTSELKSNAYR
jgi:hypothetical protein